LIGTSSEVTDKHHSHTTNFTVLREVWTQLPGASGSALRRGKSSDQSPMKKKKREKMRE
jgi:hypothetical protein